MVVGPTYIARVLKRVKGRSTQQCGPAVRPTVAAPTQGYELGEFALEFSVSVKVYSGAAGSANRTLVKEAALSPSVPHMLTDDFFLEARLLGDLMPYKQAPVLAYVTVLLRWLLSPLFLRTYTSSLMTW